MVDKALGTGGRKSDKDLKIRVKSAKGRKVSSTKWLERQLNDPYVARARAEGYRSRAAFKLIEIDDKSISVPRPAAGRRWRPRRPAPLRPIR